MGGHFGGVARGFVELTIRGRMRHGGPQRAAAAMCGVVWLFWEAGMSMLDACGGVAEVEDWEGSRGTKNERGELGMCAPCAGLASASLPITSTAPGANATFSRWSTAGSQKQRACCKTAGGAETGGATGHKANNRRRDRGHKTKRALIGMGDWDGGGVKREKERP